MNAMRSSLVPAAVLSLVSVTPDSTHAQCQVGRIVRNGTAAGFGDSMAADGDRLIVGAPRGISPSGSSRGVAYLYRWNDTAWVEEATLYSSDGTSAEFGWSVAIRADRAIVGAFDGGFHGQAYIFELDGSQWVERAILAPDATEPSFSGFGRSVALDGDLAVVGAWRAPPAGAAYTFRKGESGWARDARLTIGSETYGSFGYAVGVEGDLAVIGAPGQAQRGKAYACTNRDNLWFLSAVLDPVPVGEEDEFGVVVAVRDRWTAVTAPIIGSGSVYVYPYDAKFTVPPQQLTTDAPGIMFFGASLAVDDSLLVVGTPYVPPWGDPGRGYATSFRFDAAAGAWGRGGDLVPAVLPVDPRHTTPAFGYAAAVTWPYAMVSAPGLRDEAVYVFLADGRDCNENGVVDYCDGLGDTLPALGEALAACNCMALSPPSPEADAIPKNRCLSFLPPASPRKAALRVTVIEAPSAIEGLTGQAFWVGDPAPMTEIAGLTDTSPPTFLAARLCDGPNYHLWDSAGPLHVCDGAVVPGARYAIQAIDSECALWNEAVFSEALVVATARWGDVAGPLVQAVFGPPDGRVDITADIIAVLNKFVGRANAPSKIQSDLVPAVPDFVVDITDITAALDAFRDLPYPYALPPVGPCP